LVGSIVISRFLAPTFGLVDCERDDIKLACLQA
jgi:hypothetical protein